jgi:hypothetical protein
MSDDSSYQRRQVTIQELLAMAIDRRAPLSRGAALLLARADAIRDGNKQISPWAREQARLIREGADRFIAQRQRHMRRI